MSFVEYTKEQREALDLAFKKEKEKITTEDQLRKMEGTEIPNYFKFKRRKIGGFSVKDKI